MQPELALPLAVGIRLVGRRRYATPAVERAYNRARELCQRLGETPELFRVLRGIWGVYIQWPELQIARELSEQLRNLAQSMQDTALLLLARYAVGITLFYLGVLVPAR